MGGRPLFPRASKDAEADKRFKEARFGRLFTQLTKGLCRGEATS